MRRPPAGRRGASGTQRARHAYRLVDAERLRALFDAPAQDLARLAEQLQQHGELRLSPTLSLGAGTRVTGGNLKLGPVLRLGGIGPFRDSSLDLGAF